MRDGDYAAQSLAAVRADLRASREALIARLAGLSAADSGGVPATTRSRARPPCSMSPSTPVCTMSITWNNSPAAARAQRVSRYCTDTKEPPCVRSSDRPTEEAQQAHPASARPQAAAQPVGRGISLGVIFGIPGVIFVFLILALPLIAIIWRTFDSGVFLTSVRKPVVLQALRLTAWTSLLTLALSVAFGTPLAYGLARARFPASASSIPSSICQSSCRPSSPE